MIRKERFQSRFFIIAISMIVNIITIILVNLIHGQLFFFELGVLPSLTLVFGPYVAIGFILVEIPYWIFSFGLSNITGILINVAIIVILGILPWKLWYSISLKQPLEVLNINNLASIVKLAAIVAVFMFQYIFFTSNIRLIVSGMNPLEYPTMMFGVMLLLISIAVCSKYEIPYYTPKVQFKGFMPNKLYNIVLLIAFIIEFITAAFYPNNVHMGFFVLVMIIAFLFRPFDEEVFKLSNTVKLNIFSKISLSIFVVLVVISIALSLIYANAMMYDDFYLYVYNFFEMFLYLSLIFIIPLIIYMLFLQERVIKPIQQLSSYLSQDIDNLNDYNNLKENLKNITVKNEIKSLSESLLNMEKELMDHSQNLIALTKETERFETELKLAHQIQNSIIPTDFEEFSKNKNISLWGSMNAARYVGGDFYDYFTIDDDHIGFTIGDVSGKGVIAALIMVKAMTLIQDFAKQFDDLSEVFFKVNNELCRGNVEELFVTCWLGKLNIKTGELSYVNAGHNSPLINAEDGDFKYIETEHGLVLAAMEDMPYEKQTVKLIPGDSLFLYTDGVTEANIDYQGFYGEERLNDVLNMHKDDDLDIIIKAIERDVNDFCNNEEQFDDMTMFIIRFGK